MQGRKSARNGTRDISLVLADFYFIMAESNKYWIKIEKDFLNSSQIKVIKSMPNGKDYIIFYLALMLESVNTEGHLRFNELVPYNEEMLSAITDTNVDIVRTAVKIFQSLGLIKILEDGTIFLPEVPRRIGKESESAERVRLYRERQKALQSNGNVTKCNDNIEIKEELDIYKEKTVINNSRKEMEVAEPKSALPATEKPTKHKYGKYKNILLTEEEHAKLLEMPNGDRAIEYLSEYREYKGYKAKNDYLAIRKWVFNALKEEEQRANRSEPKPKANKGAQDNGKDYSEYDSIFD